MQNLTDKYKGTFKLGLVYVVAFLICYGIYEIYQYLT